MTGFEHSASDPRDVPVRRRRYRPARPAAVLALVVLLLTLSGCGAGHSDASGHTGGPADAVSNVVRMGLLEWSIPTSVSRVHAGNVTRIVTNSGGTEHDLVVQGRAGRWSTRPLGPGEKTRLVVHATKSETLHLWCNEPGHRAQGMHTELKVLAH